MHHDFFRLLPEVVKTNGANFTVRPVFDYIELIHNICLGLCCLVSESLALFHKCLERIAMVLCIKRANINTQVAVLWA